MLLQQYPCLTLSQGRGTKSPHTPRERDIPTSPFSQHKPQHPAPFPRIIQPNPETPGVLPKGKPGQQHLLPLQRDPLLRLTLGESEQPPGGSNMTNAWHMFALSPSPRGEAWSSKLNIAECECVCVPGYLCSRRQGHGKVRGREVLSSWGAHSQGSVPKKRRNSAWSRISGAVGTREMLGVVLEEAGTQGRGAAAPQTHLDPDRLFWASQTLQGTGAAGCATPLPHQRSPKCGQNGSGICSHTQSDAGFP